MHDTAFEIGGLVIKRYCPEDDASILEIGSLDVNGSLRSHSGEKQEYIGIDYSAGPSVDFVIEPGGSWPVRDATFDLVIASSVFEHDSIFWETFAEMARKTKPGGYIYVNVPSNGWVHRYPLDCWRFYPDCGQALVLWAQRQGYHVTLVESFIAERHEDVWNDFCAVFRREPAHAELPEDFIYTQVRCVNVITWMQPEMFNIREQPEDMVLLASERSEQSGLKEHVARLEQELSDQEKKILELGRKYARVLSEVRVASAQKIAAERQVNERFNELASLTHLLQQTTKEGQIYARQTEWMRRAISALITKPRWWTMIPKTWRQRQQRDRLKREGIFDGDAYLARYPDVLAAKMDPFHHYILHGLSEGRISKGEEK